MKNFVLIGAAGFIAPRHMRAIKDTGNKLVAALDPHDSVGVLDSYFPDTDFFTEFERFDRHCEKLRRSGTPIDYVVVCSPNYLHDAHIRFGLRIGADVICEKPVVLNPWNLDGLLEMEKETGKNVYTILQLRNHPDISLLKNKVQAATGNQRHEVNVKYVSVRGHWYKYSWKGDVSKSGGITTNIGLHFFDILLWIFGEVEEIQVTQAGPGFVSGTLLLAKAKVKWELGTEEQSLPAEIKKEGKTTYRMLSVDGANIEFSSGFADLHTACYSEILSGKGVSLTEMKRLTELLYRVRLLEQESAGSA